MNAMNPVARTCGTGGRLCTACCKIDRDPFEKAHGAWCPQCIVGRGCALFGQPSRPSQCGKRSCDWRDGHGSDADRPDITKVMLESQTGTLAGDVRFLWEISQGALNSSFARQTMQEAVKRRLRFMLVYLSSRRILYLPEFVLSTIDADAIRGLDIEITQYKPGATVLGAQSFQPALIN
jgi:hypothetical protein